MQFTFRNRSAYLLVVLLGIVVLIVAILLVYTQSQLALTQKVTTPPASDLAPADTNSPLQTVKFANGRASSSLAVEFLEKPRLLGKTYIAKATIPIGEQSTKFDVIIGGSDGQSASGTCDYIKKQSMFSGNSSYFHEPTSQLADKIKPGVKALLQINHANATEEEWKRNPGLIAMERIFTAAKDNKSLTGITSIVPDEFCIANPL